MDRDRPSHEGRRHETHDWKDFEMNQHETILHIEGGSEEPDTDPQTQEGTGKTGREGEVDPNEKRG